MSLQLRTVAMTCFTTCLIMLRARTLMSAMRSEMSSECVAAPFACDAKLTSSVASRLP